MAEARTGRGVRIFPLLYAIPRRQLTGEGKETPKSPPEQKAKDALAEAGVELIVNN
jgi:hypothetical protein